MSNIPLGEVKDHLSEYIAEVARTHDRVTITRHGTPTAVLLSIDDLESMEETLDILSTPGELDAIRDGLADAERRDFIDNDALKARYGIRD